MSEQVEPEDMEISSLDQSSVDLVEAEGIINPGSDSTNRSSNIMAKLLSNRSQTVGSISTSRFLPTGTTSSVSEGEKRPSLQNKLKSKVLDFIKGAMFSSSPRANLFRIQMQNAKEQFFANKLMWEIKFKFLIFLKFFVIHLVAHACLPASYLFRLCHSKQFITNLSLIGKGAIWQYCIWICQMSFMAYFMFRMPPERDYAMAFNFFLGILLRTVVISLKYAYMSHPDLKILDTLYLSYQEKERHQLLTGWEVYRPLSMETEIQQATERLMIEEEDLQLNFMERPTNYVRDRLEWQVTQQEDQVFRAKTYKKMIQDMMQRVKEGFKQTSLEGARAYVSQFTVVSSPRKSNSLTRDQSKKAKYKAPEKGNEASVEATATELQRKYKGKRIVREIVMMSLVQPRFGKILGFLSIILLWAVPIAMMAIGMGEWPLKTYDDYILCMIAFPTNYFIYYPNFQYVMTGISDFRRKVFFMNCASKLIDNLHTSANSLLIPGLDLTLSQNLYNWFKLRKILLNIGTRFTSRILGYLGGLLILSGFMLVLLFLEYFGMIKLMFSPLTYAYIAFYLSYIFVSCLVMMHMGVAVNVFFLKHINSLRNFKFELKRMINRGQTSLDNLQEPSSVLLRQLKRLHGLYSIENKPTEEGAADQPSQNKRGDYLQMVEALDDVIQSLEHEYEHNSLRMLGISLTPSVMSTVWGFLFSLVVAFISGNLQGQQ